MVAGPTLEGTATRRRPSTAFDLFPMALATAAPADEVATAETVYVCRSPRPSEPAPSRAVIGGTPA